MKIEVLHGPNLNLLGTREPDVYGRSTLDAVNHRLLEVAGELGVEVESFQSNHEGALIDRIHETARRAGGYVVNAAGYTHTSVALRDALVAVDRPFVEVHLTNVYARDRFRSKSMLAPVALGTVSGFGAESYALGLRALVRHLELTRRG